ncbi:MAG TPA: hypothetical protein VKR82_06670 [Candidatus Acidoferrales bacterium]|nr:hypothetical protein [Candidatus Acidoferrales bacterium]
MKAFSNLLRRSPFYGELKTLGHYPDYWYWKLRGQPARSPHLLKQRTVLDYSRRFSLHILIETGTYYGEMVAAMRSHFDRIDSIEQNPELAQRAAKRFGRFPQIHIHQGDSQSVLPELLKSLNQPALFWLDAGYYGWAGLQGVQQRLGVELEAILRHRLSGHVTLMDDARGLSGENGALTVAELTQRVANEFPGRRVEVAYDILRITPEAY